MITFSKLHFLSKLSPLPSNSSFLLFDHIGVIVYFVVMATAAAGTLPY